MTKQYHILNGDALKEQFPKSIPGELIVTRECLVDGSVRGNTLAEFYETRAGFIENSYSGYSQQGYFEKTVSEFQKMQDIPDNAEINLWFEDDLFCQVNFWFVINLLVKSKRNHLYFLVRPKSHSPYSFGRLGEAELLSVYENRIRLTETDKLAKLWDAYRIDDTAELIQIAEQLKDSYPFIPEAVIAHMERIPGDGKLGRPEQTLIQIMKDLKTDEFGPVFREFCRREEIYGFGDLQVKRMLDEIINKRNEYK